jgi:4-hydroxythreonine-4-phosphate dehydrogenase
MGDPGGIGPEIAVKAALDKRVRAICERSWWARATCRPVQQENPHARTAGRDFTSAKSTAEQGWRRSTRPHRDRGAMSGEYRGGGPAPHSETAIPAAASSSTAIHRFVARTTGLAPEDGILMLCLRAWRARVAHRARHAARQRAPGARHAFDERVVRTIRAVRDAPGQGSASSTQDRR